MASKLDGKQLNEISKSEEMQNQAWSKKSTTLERILCIIIVILLITIAFMVASLVLFGSFYQKNTDSEKKTFVLQDTDNLLASESSVPNLCLTPGCVKAAAEILSSLDQNIKPCDDFYRFACGGWLNQTAIPEDRSSMSMFDKTEDILNLKLKDLMEKKLDEKEPSFIKMLKEMYDTCMDIERIEKAGSKPLRKILRYLGNWPVVEGTKWNESKFDWIQVLTSLRKYGFQHNILLRVSVTADSINNSFNIIELDQTLFGKLDRSYLISGLNDSATAAYFKQMVKAASFLGANETTVESELLEALKFEMTLAKIPWLKFFNGLLTNEIFENETLIVAVPEFVKKFAVLIKNTEKRVIANYMLWKVVCESLPFLSKKWREIAVEYDKALSGKKREEPRWEQCLSHLNMNLDIALSFYYVSHYFKEENKDAATELVKYIHREFLHNLDEIDWMDKITKLHARSKANNMILYIGYPEQLLNNTAVLEHYQNLTLSNGSHFENILRVHKWSKDNHFDKLKKSNIRGWWKYHAYVAVVNAFCDFTHNSISIPAGILQNPYFKTDRPNYLNFGGIGKYIGHEIIHGFDDEGRQYDKDGNNINWWEKTTDENFKKRVRCMIDQYSNYTAENGMKLNGVKTVGENIADNGGLKNAYRAYQTWVKDNDLEQLLPGLKYNQNQLFWISAANVECSKHRPEDLKRQIISYVHSPGEFRVIGSVSNLAEFAEDFNCPPEAPMNKKPKCQMW